MNESKWPITNRIFFFYSDAPQYHSSSCPCPMQSCPKNAHTGTGPAHKGPVSANNSKALAESIPKIPAVSAVVATCKIESILAQKVTIKPENCEKSVEKSIDLYSSKVLELPEQTASPARGSTTGLQIPPTVQHEAVQPIENISSDSLCLSQRKQPRVGKTMERERQLQQHITMLIPEEVPVQTRVFREKRRRS